MIDIDGEDDHMCSRIRCCKGHVVIPTYRELYFEHLNRYTTQGLRANDKGSV